MKAEELQIGDWVMLNGSYYQIEEISQKGWVHLVKDGNRVNLSSDYIIEILEGVPLQRIHLTKNGFKATDETDLEFIYRDGYEIKVEFDEGYEELGVPPSIFLLIGFAEKDLTIPIEYVHELQQAMRIMGCNKEIKL